LYSFIFLNLEFRFLESHKFSSNSTFENRNTADAALCIFDQTKTDRYHAPCFQRGRFIKVGLLGTILPVMFGGTEILSCHKPNDNCRINLIQSMILNEKYVGLIQSRSIIPLNGTHCTSFDKSNLKNVQLYIFATFIQL
jgi:hypothetical protein